MVHRVVIAEDNYLVREGTRRLLEDGGQVEVLATVENAADLLRVVDQLSPDCVLTDIRMPPHHSTEGIVAAHAIRARHPGIGVVVLSQHAEEGYAFDLLSGGSGGLAYLLKDRLGDLEELQRAIVEVAEGRSVIDSEVVDLLVTRRRRQALSPLRELSPRELEVLEHMAQGRTNAGIADALYLSESSIEKHVNSIFAKLGIVQESQTHRRVMAVLTFLRDGIPSAR